MTTETIAAGALERAVQWVRGQIARDRNNRYSLLRDWTLPAARCSWWPDTVSDWSSPLLRIERAAPGVVVVTVRAYRSTAADNICDGATLSPDSIPGILPAALFHDPWYYRGPGDAAKTYERIAAAAGVSPRTARKFGDALFWAIARAGGCPALVAWAYYAGIRIGYPIVRPFLGALLAALLAAGAAGCIAQGCAGTFLDPTEYTPPLYIREASGTTTSTPFYAAAYSPRIAP